MSEKLSRQRYLALYEAACCLTREDGDLNQTAIFNLMKVHIAEGAPLNPVQAHDGSILEPLLAILPTRRDDAQTEALAFIQALIEQGANPMLQGVFTVDLLETQETLANTLLCSMRKATDNGHAMLDAAGQTPLHVCLSTDAWGSAQFEALRLQVSTQWLDHRRGMDGKTPLHVLWSEIERSTTRPGSMVSAGGVWRATKILLDLGASMDVRDDRGLPLSRIMARCVHRGFRVNNAMGWEVLDLAKVHNEQLLLRGSTRKVSARRTRARI